jgi:hypothetical protein
MKYFQETTDWGNNKTPNHIYYLKDDKSSMVGYIKVGTKKLIKLSVPITIDVRGRKFVELKDKKGEPDSVYFIKKPDVKSDNVVTVEGSNGKKYTLEKIAGKYVCNCPGYTFRQKCKHSDEMNKNENRIM